MDPRTARFSCGLLLLLLLAAAPGAAPAARAEGGAADNRFFPKEMEDALVALRSPDPEDSFHNGLAALARLRGRDGSLDPMRKDAFAPILEHALSTRLEHVASFAGEILAGLDPDRMAAELLAVADRESEGRRLLNAAALLEEVGPGRERRSPAAGVAEALVRIAGKGSQAARIRAAEALGEVASLRRGCPEKPREVAVYFLLSAYGSAGKDTDLKNVCAVALGKIGSARAIPPLLSGLSVTDGKHAFVAALALSWIEDPAIFPTLQGAGPSGGESLEAFCKALEGCAREAHVDGLVNTLQASGKAEVRLAAASALGRILPAFPVPGPGGTPSGATAQEKERSARRARAAEVLFARMVSDPSPLVQWACFHAVARAGGPWLEEPVLGLLKSTNASTIARAVHLAGDWKLKGAAKVLLGAIFSVKDSLLRRRCAIEFWRIGDREAVEEFKGKLLGLEGGVAFSRGCDALGSWRCREAFDLALDLLRSTRDGSQEQFAVENALDKMTGHFFGPYPGVWNKWFGKNPQFFTPKQARIEREKWREEFDKENKGYRQTKETEKAVQMGLEYLARHQHPDGRWDPQAIRERCDRSPACSAGSGARVQEDPTGRTGLCILAFLGAGYSPESGKFKVAIRRGLDYLTNDLIGGYNRPIALQAYAEACTLTKDPRYVPFVQRGVDFLSQIQNSIGGWRYRVDVETSDSSVASWMLFSMKAAQKAGVEVREIVFEGCRMLFERYSVRVPQDGPREDFVDIDPAYGFEVGSKAQPYEYRTGYQDQAYAQTHATTALGLMSHILLGYRRSHPFCIGSANHILAKQLPQAPKDGNMERLNIRQEYPMYFLYYGTLAMHQMGGRYFRTWNEQVRVILPATQIKGGCSRGAWQGTALDGIFGSIYTTATGVMALETYYRYLPVLQD